MRNEQFGPAAGSPNWAQGDTPNRFAYQDHVIRQSRGELFGEPMMQVLPTFAPFKWAFGDYGIYPEDAIAAGSGESLDRTLWGGQYYGYHPYRDHGYPAAADNASYAAFPRGYTDPLYDPDQDLWHYGVPSDAQPELQDQDPWDSAHRRHAMRGRSHHSSRSEAGSIGGMDHAYETLGFHGGSQ